MRLERAQKGGDALHFFGHLSHDFRNRFRTASFPASESLSPIAASIEAWAGLIQARGAHSSWLSSRGWLGVFESDPTRV